MNREVKLILGVLSLLCVQAQGAVVVDPKIQALLDTGDPLPNLVIGFDCPLNTVFDTFNSLYYKSNYDRNTAIRYALVQHSEYCQQVVISILVNNGIEYYSHWITPKLIVISPTNYAINEIIALDYGYVSYIRPEKAYTLDRTTYTNDQRPSSFKRQSEHQNYYKYQNPKTSVHCVYPDCPGLSWGVAISRAHLAWDYGADGTGIVVGTIDTGVRWSHEALKDNFRYDYNWFAAYPFTQSDKPYYLDPHGTHTLGSMCGRKGIGVAPGAEWITCLACNGKSCPESAVITCAEFMACPTHADGSKRNCSKAPHVLSCGWSGTEDDDTLKDITFTLRAFGIIPVFSIGNDGPYCHTAKAPGRFPTVIGVGATRFNDTIATFSSRGPVKSETATYAAIKPDLGAPGESILSAWTNFDENYNYLNGTSTAAPHVAGAVAVLLSYNPKWNFEEVKKRLQTGAWRPPAFLSTCGSYQEEGVWDSWPNNVMGHGRLDVYGALTYDSYNVHQEQARQEPYIPEQYEEIYAYPEYQGEPYYDPDMLNV